MVPLMRFFGVRFERAARAAEGGPAASGPPASRVVVPELVSPPPPRDPTPDP
jgi:hypothetical protein